jgi:hypothetical protein
MLDRRWVTDVGLALLIALPAILPAAPGPWAADTEISYLDPEAVEALTGEPDSAALASASKWDDAQAESTS